jgi:t-SNARE complex subunit (syntaxin)
MNIGGEMTEQNLSRHYEDFSKEASRLLYELKNSKEHNEEREIQKQLGIVQTISTNIIKLRNIKKKAKDKL